MAENITHSISTSSNWRVSQTSRQTYSCIDAITNLIDAGASIDHLLHSFSQNITAFESLLDHNDLDSNKIVPLLTILTSTFLRHDSSLSERIHKHILTSNFVSPNGPLLEYTLELIQENEHLLSITNTYLLHLYRVIPLFELLQIYDSVRPNSNFNKSIQLFCSAVRDSSNYNSLQTSAQGSIEKLYISCKGLQSDKLHYQFTDNRYYGGSHRDMPILPAPGEVAFRPRRSLRSLVKKGVYPDVETFLDVHFKLLREDMIRPIRQGVNNFFNNDKEFKKDLYVYSNVCMLETRCDERQGVLYEVSFHPDGIRDISRIRWDRSKRLIFGTLLLIFPMDSVPGEEVSLHDPLWAVVVNKDDKQITNACAKGLRDPNIAIQFESGFEPQFSYYKRYYMLESRKVYYEAYKHTLSILQQMNPSSLPFQEIILGHSTTTHPPRYVTPRTAYPMSRIFPRLDGPKLRVLSSWPERSPIMDESQYKAVKLALTNQLAVIQGPPGTGKTYVGTHVIKVLLETRKHLQYVGNKHRNLRYPSWHRRNRDAVYEEIDNSDLELAKVLNDRPILVVTYTNHALDQFLGSILDFESNIIRIGNRSEDERIKALSLRNRRDFRRGTLDKQERGRLNSELSRLTKYLQNTSRRLTSVSLITEGDVGFYATPSQVNKLLNHPIYSFSNWLNCVDLNFNPMLKFKSTTTEKTDVDNRDTEEIDEVFSDSENEDAVDFNENLIGYISDEEYFSKQDTPSQGDVIPDFFNRDLVYDSQAYADPWALDKADRNKLIDYWISLKKEYLSSQLESAQSQYNDLSETLKEHFIAVDSFALRQAAVVGMTTTGAAKNSELIRTLRPYIIFIEESAEVLEAHVIACLSESVQHLILIGDHKQLRPSFAEFSLLRHNLDISLFERLLNNDFKHVTLQCQHRMRPEISQLVRHIYPHLIDDSTVFNFPRVKGVKRDLYFIDHKIPEDRSDVEGLSKQNSHEAKFIAKLTDYLLKQGYQETEITILTFYEVQKYSIKDELYKISKTFRIRVSTVDKYQGEENRIILFSAVRSNKENNIGHCRTDNRVCVALSRAREGLYLIGNSLCLREGGKRSGLWDKVLDTLDDKLGVALPLICQNHPHKITNVSCAVDFKKVPNGGCDLPCGQVRPCGHTCVMLCHIHSHDSIKCQEFCDRIRECGHQCVKGGNKKLRKKCFEKCDDCEISVEKVLQQCGHRMDLPCCIEPLHVLCGEKCNNTLSCGHECTENCGTDCTEVKCLKLCERVHPCGHPCVERDGRTTKRCYSRCDACYFLVEKPLNECGHKLLLPCHSSPDYYLCKQPCEKVLQCGHVCQRTCGENCDELGCTLPCNKSLPCGHNCTEYCNKPCTQRCIVPCMVVKPCNHPCVRNDGVTPKICSDYCGDCNYLVDKEVPSCKHTMNVRCSLELTSDMCDTPCVKLLKCGHKCPGLCGEDCSLKTCRELVLKCLPCGHEVKLPCPDDPEDPSIKCTLPIDIPLLCGHALTIACVEKSKLTIEDIKCSKLCTFQLPCGHHCSGSCHDCIYGSDHVMCKQKCGRSLPCGHACNNLCHGLVLCAPCMEKCPNWCPHGKCNHSCGIPCVPCKKPCVWKCSHMTCDLECNEPCTRTACKLRCPKKLKCKHQCVGVCGEPCPDVCRKCSKKSATFADRFGAEGDPESRFVLLEDCGHVFEVDRFESEWLMSTFGGRQCLESVSLPLCPTCSTPIRHNFRFSLIIKPLLIHIEEIKHQVIEDFRNSCVHNCITLQEDFPPNEFHLQLHRCFFDIERIAKNCQPHKLAFIHKLILLLSQLYSHPPSLIPNDPDTSIHFLFLECNAIYRLLEDSNPIKSDILCLSELSTYAEKCVMFVSFDSIFKSETVGLSDEDLKKLQSLFQQFSSHLKENPLCKRKPVTDHLTACKCFIYELGLRYTLEVVDSENTKTMSYPAHCYVKGWYFCKRQHPFATRDLNLNNPQLAQCFKCNTMYL